MYNNIFDTHAHYDDEAFDNDRNELLTSLPAKGVAGIISCGCDINSTNFNKELSEKYKYIYFAAGFHPENLEGADIKEIKSIEKFLTHRKCVAVGEIGLDYHYMDTEKNIQIEFFKRQIDIANNFNMPVIVHDREAHGDTLSILQEKQPRGVLHCFSGSVETAKEILKLGMYLGFGGSCTFKNSKKVLEVIAATPVNRILLETDCPYLAPVPYRGKRNDSSLIKYTAEKIAEIKKLSAQEIINAAAENAKQLFGI